MSGKRVVVLSINGRDVEVPARPTDTLLDTLREGLGLTGAKRGCNQGLCGACSVLLDGRTFRSCLSLTLNCTDRTILTVEGLANGNELDPVQEAFVASGAIQCGYCMPGMVLAARALLDENPHPEVDAIREAIGGNLCRCSGYTKIVEAIRMMGHS